MILRPASLDDTESLAALGRDSFVAAFGHIYHPPDLECFLQETYAPEVVAREIAHPDRLHHLAITDDRLAGFCKLALSSPYAKHSDAQRPIALGQLYTQPRLTGQGIGAALMDWTLGEARGRNADAIQLSVYSDNPGAQRFYARYGFTKIADVDFWVGTHRDDEFLFELRL
ncbi:GNAT family N-acetyltransferase [Altererythrobacter sp. SALINAS58]|uniref:GNAT family N-acetyltransferase n=1 Tax=Alteripontixanthobacter muriae TaxID=2705546 RepID=UPI0015766AAA|nr:GNAT family N-acetyltransferase [Alteripontixanthobacter muriae]NTZ43171.1 GNAT family N-acetyltransferase [Alteripontixanthobacter muriae]